MPVPDTVATAATLAATVVVRVTPDAIASVPPLSEQLPPVTDDGPAFTFTELPAPLTLRPAVHVAAAAAVSVPPEVTETADAYVLCATASVSTPAVTDVDPLKPTATATAKLAPLTRSMPDVPVTEAPAAKLNALAWKSSVALPESVTAPDHTLAPLDPPPIRSVPVSLTLTALLAFTVVTTFTVVVMLPVFVRPPLPAITSEPEPDSTPPDAVLNEADPLCCQAPDANAMSPALHDTPACVLNCTQSSQRTHTTHWSQGTYRSDAHHH